MLAGAFAPISWRINAYRNGTFRQFSYKHYSVKERRSQVEITKSYKFNTYLNKNLRVFSAGIGVVTGNFTHFSEMGQGKGYNVTLFVKGDSYQEGRCMSKCRKVRQHVKGESVIAAAQGNRTSL